MFMTLGHWSNSSSESSSSTLPTKVKEAALYCAQNNLDTTWAVFIDYSIHSGYPRLFAVDLQNQTVLNQGLCSHGCGTGAWGADQTKTNPTFSNVPDSHQSSLGKYKIGQRGWSNWGIHVNYKLHGLESSNSKAYERFIVLHSWEAIPDTNLYPNGTPEGWGCPAVSNTQMRWLDEKIKETKQPVLLWIYE